MINKLLAIAFSLKRQGYYKKSIETFYKALEIDNSSIELLYEIAELYYQIKKEEHALSYVEQILNQNPIHIPSLRLLQQIFLNKKAFKEAEQTAKNIYLITGNESDLVEVLKLLNISKKYSDVIQYEINDDNPSLAYEKGVALFSQEKLESAQNYLEEHNKPNNELILILLGKIYYKLEKYNLCDEIIKKIHSQCENPQFLNLIGLIENHHGNINKAIEYFKSAISIEPQNAEYYYNLADAYLKNNNSLLAKKNYTIAINHEPNNELYNYGLAKLYYYEKRYKQALERLKGNDFNSKILKIMILYDTGDYTLALKELNNLEIEHQNNETVQMYKYKVEQKLLDI